jgi:lambda repressor-like predicted transcriptional regulator
MTPDLLPPSLTTRVVTMPNGCWHWTGAKRSGYGVARFNGREQGVHRIVYEQLVGALVDGFTVHHTCGVRRCVNPAHLTPMRASDHSRLHLTQWRAPVSIKESAVAAVAELPARKRLRAAMQLSGVTYAQLALKVGVSRSHLASGTQGSARLSLTTKLRVARVLGVPASILWPELQTLAFDILYGWKTRGRTK